jgi:hypothetical protein
MLERTPHSDGTRETIPIHFDVTSSSGTLKHFEEEINMTSNEVTLMLRILKLHSDVADLELRFFSLAPTDWTVTFPTIRRLR